MGSNIVRKSKLGGYMNLIRFIATKAIFKSNQPWLQREMLVSP